MPDLDDKLGGDDRQKLDQYLSCVRELELRIARAETLPPVVPPEGAVKPQTCRPTSPSTSA